MRFHVFSIGFCNTLSKESDFEIINKAIFINEAVIDVISLISFEVAKL